MTKTSKFLQNTNPQLKRITFEFLLNNNGEVHEVNSLPNAIPAQWDNVMLLSSDKKDLMYAWDDDAPNNGCVYCGKFNDGIV